MAKMCRFSRIFAVRAAVTGIWVSVFAGSAWPTSAQVPAYRADETKRFCEIEWPGDFTMQNYCIEQHQAGFAGFSELASREGELGMVSAMEACLEEWLPDWSMANYCAGQQLEGRDVLSQRLAEVPEDVAATITAQCEKDWRNDFAMLAYCAEQQVSAWKEINN
jgi:hypothetical protein